MEENNNIIKDKNELTKVLLMGKAGVGKTSIKSLIFQNRLAKDTIDLAFTNELEVTHLRFMKNIYLKLIDCCSREIKQYFDSKKEKIFSKVKLFIFVAEAEKHNHKNENDNLDDLEFFEK